MSGGPADRPCEDTSLHPLDRYPRLYRAALTVVVSLLVGLALALATNGLPIAEATKRMAARSYMPNLTVGYPSSGRDQITVLTLDDLDLEHVGLTWPVPMDYYQRLIDRLVALKARALFIDVVFLDDRPRELVARFAQSACAATEAGVPIYLASIQEQGHSSRTMNQLAEARTVQGEPCLRFVAPNLLNDRFDRSLWEYPLQIESPNGGAPLRSAALAMACDLDSTSCPANSATAMAMLWPAKGDPLNPSLHLQNDGQGGLEPSCVSELPSIDYVPLLPSPLRNWLHGGVKPDLCPYHKQVPVRALSGVGLSAAERDEVIAGKIVMLGTAFQSHGDRIDTPLQQNLAGVHSHAMALDNLLSLHGEYRRSGDFSLSDLGSPASLFTISAVALIALGSVAWHLLSVGRPVVRIWRPRAWHLLSAGRPMVTTERQPTQTRVLLEGWLKHPNLPSKPWPTRARVFTLRMVALPLLHLLTLSRWPGDGSMRGSPLWRDLLRSVMAMALAFLGIGVIFWLGDRLFRVGPLSVIEYVLFPLGVDFLDRGQVLARHVAVLLHASAAVDPVAELRRWLGKGGD